MRRLFVIDDLGLFCLNSFNLCFTQVAQKPGRASTDSTTHQVVLRVARNPTSHPTSQTPRFRILGILNVTPDSFSDGGRYLDPAAATECALKMIAEGADLIDIGAVSTRPGANPVSPDEEVKRLSSILDSVLSVVDPSLVCIDAGSVDAIRFSYERGIRMFNLCGGISENYLEFLKGTTVIVYPNHHSCDRTNPEQGRMKFFEEQIRFATQDQSLSLILDPGIGFGLKTEGSIELLRSYPTFQALGHPLVVGVSRKSHLARLLGRDPETTPFEDRIEAGLAAATVAVRGGATIVRTHDVAQTKRFFTAFDALELQKRNKEVKHGKDSGEGVPS